MKRFLSLFWLAAVCSQGIAQGLPGCPSAKVPEPNGQSRSNLGALMTCRSFRFRCSRFGVQFPVRSVHSCPKFPTSELPPPDCRAAPGPRRERVELRPLLGVRPCPLARHVPAGHSDAGVPARGPRLPLPIGTPRKPHPLVPWPSRGCIPPLLSAHNRHLCFMISQLATVCLCCMCASHIPFPLHFERNHLSLWRSLCVGQRWGPVEAQSCGTVHEVLTVQLPFGGPAPIDLCGAQTLSWAPTFSLANWDVSRTMTILDNKHTVQAGRCYRKI